MNIFLRRNNVYNDNSQCQSASIVPGEEIDIYTASVTIDSGHVVKEVPGDQVLLLDKSGSTRLKIVCADCQFFMPTNVDEWEAVKPILKELAERRVLVLSELSHKHYDLQLINEACRGFFYSPVSGVLFNNKFECDLSPEEKASAGLMSAGDSSVDVTASCFEWNHSIDFWNQSDWPKDRRPKDCQCLCVEEVKYKIPFLFTTDSQAVPAQLFKVNMCLSHDCDEAVLITHSGAPVKMTPWSDIVTKVDAARLAAAESSLLANRVAGRTTDAGYFDLLKQSIHLASFSSLLRDFDHVNKDFMTQLCKYKTELHDLADLALTHDLLKKLTSGVVVNEVQETVQKLATLKLVNETIFRLNYLPPAAHKAISSSMEMVAISELRELANAYEKRYFLDDWLNRLITDGTICSLFVDDHCDCSKLDEELKLLSLKGFELSRSMVSISETIRNLLNPFMIKQVEPFDLAAEIKPEHY